MTSTNTMGFSSDRVRSPPGIEFDDIECAICHYILWKPFACGSCETHFYSACITSWHRTNPKNCPIQCQEYVQRSSVKFVANKLAKLQIGCLYQAEGCEVWGQKRVWRAFENDSRFLLPVMISLEKTMIFVIGTASFMYWNMFHVKRRQNIPVMTDRDPRHEKMTWCKVQNKHTWYAQNEGLILLQVVSASNFVGTKTTKLSHLLCQMKLKDMPFGATFHADSNIMLRVIRRFDSLEG